MGCGCKNKKKNMSSAKSKGVLTNSEEEINGRRRTVKETKDYQNKVRDALRQLMDIKKKKQNLRR